MLPTSPDGTKGSPLSIFFGSVRLFFRNFSNVPKGSPLWVFCYFATECVFINQKRSPLLHFSALCNIFPKENFFSKISSFFQKNVLRFLSLRYSADLRRSRLVLYFFNVFVFTFQPYYTIPLVAPVKTSIRLGPPKTSREWHKSAPHSGLKKSKSTSRRQGFSFEKFSLPKKSKHNWLRIYRRKFGSETATTIVQFRGPNGTIWLLKILQNFWLDFLKVPEESLWRCMIGYVHIPSAEFFERSGVLTKAKLEMRA